MRSVLCALLLLVGCDAASNTNDGTTGGIDPAQCPSGAMDPCPPGVTSCDIPEDSGLTKRCSCVETGSQYWWACSDCPFGEGSEPVACTTPGLGCNITTWEHDCECGCTATGWWSCQGGTIGSHCPMAPVDAGVDAM